MHQQQQQQQPPQATVNNLQEQMANAMERVNEAAHTVGQKVTDFFQGDPFSTPVGRKIELATDANKLATENWGLNMEICDFINCTNEGPRDAVRAIKKRLQTQMGKNNAIVMYTLTVLETCVKNCDERFAVLVTNKDFVGELVKLISTKHDAPQIVQERVLGIIQSWADAFRGNSTLSGVVELYDEFRAKGVEFPATNFDAMAPIITPKQTVFPNSAEFEQRKTVPAALHNQQQQHSFPISATARPDARVMVSQPQRQQLFVGGGDGPVSATPEQMAKLRSELDIVQVNLTVLRELVAQMKPTGGGGADGKGTEPPEDFHFIQELYSTCKAMQNRILSLIPTITNEEVTFELLSVNDELNATFDKYDRCMANFNAHGVDVSMVPSGSGSHQQQQQKAEKEQALLIDLNTPGTAETKKTLADQFQSIDIHNGGDAGGLDKTGLSNPAYVHDQAELPIRSVAYNKPDTGANQQQKKGAHEEAEKKPLLDDGL